VQCQGHPACHQAVWAHGTGPAGLLGMIRICAIPTPICWAFMWIRAGSLNPQVSLGALGHCALNIGVSQPPSQSNLVSLSCRTGPRLEAIDSLQWKAHSSGLQQSKQAVLLLELFLVAPGVSLTHRRLPCSRLCAILSPEALLACAPLGCLWKLQPAFVSLFRTQPLGKGAQPCADCARSTVLQAPVAPSVRIQTKRTGPGKRAGLAHRMRPSAPQKTPLNRHEKLNVFAVEPQGTLGSNTSQT
jgi:hypothetical protein